MIKFLNKAANWKFILPSLILFSIFVYLFTSYQQKINEIAGQELEPLYSRHAYTMDEVKALFSAMKEEGRAKHQFVIGKLDMVFPVVYTVLFILLLAFFIRTIWDENSKWLYLSLFPLLLFVVDYFENFNTLELLATYPNLNEATVNYGSMLTGIKQQLTLTIMVLSIIGLIIWTWKLAIHKMKN